MTTSHMRDRTHLTPLICALAIFATPPALGAQAPTDPLPTDPAVTVDTLPNGLRYYIRVNHEPQHRAELRLVVHAGSVLEDDDQQGLAHFAEHMAFNGTANFPKQTLVDYLEFIGMRFGPDVNAYTSFDETVYMLQLPTDSAAVVRTAFQILEDWARAVSFDSVEIEKERGVVIEEWRLGQGAGRRILDQQLPVVFKGSKYAERLPIGKKETLETFERPALVRFYRDWYRPNLMAVVAVGDFDATEIEGLIRQHFGTMTNPPDPRPRPTIEVPSHAEPLFAIATDAEATRTSVSVLFKQDPRDHSTYGAYRQGIVEGLFTAMLNARLFELSQQADPPFLGASVGQGRFVGANEVFQMGAGVQDGGVPRGLEALLTEAERVARFGFTEPELERVKARRLRGMERAFAERDKTSSGVYASEYIRNFLEGEAFPGIATELEITQRVLPEITLDETNRIASEWITPGNRVVLVSAPEKEDVPVPTEAALAAVFAGVGGTDIAAYADTLGAATLVASPPEPGTIVSETTVPEIGVTEWTLSNGVHVFLKPTDFKDDEILVRAASPGGSSLAPDSVWLSANMAASVVGVSGVGAFSAVDLRKVLAGKAVTVRPSIGANEEGFFGSGSPKDIETLFQLIYLYATAPRTDSAAYSAFLGRLRASTENRDASPEAHFGDTLQITLTQGHPRARPITRALLDSLDLGHAIAFYRDRFADLGDFTFFFVGNLDLDAIRPLVETWLGGLPTTGREETWRDLGIRPPTGVIEKVVTKGVEPRARFRIIFTGAFEDSREHRYMLRSLGDALRIRLREVLREDLGGVYGVGAGGSSSIVPDTSYSFSISFSADPERVDELKAATVATIRAFQETGPSDSIVAKVQEAQRRSRETSLRQNSYWLGQLVGAYEYGNDPREILTYESLIDGLTAAAIRDAARRYIRLDNYVEVRLVPEAADTTGR